MGVKKNPAINPTTEPTVPSLLPPLFFVNIEGKMLSKIETATARSPVKIKTQTLIWLNEIQCAKSKPTQASGAPGITGTTVPTKPMSKSKLAIIVKIMSRVIFLFSLRNFIFKSVFSSVEWNFCWIFSVKTRCTIFSASNQIFQIL